MGKRKADVSSTTASPSVRRLTGRGPLCLAVGFLGTLFLFLALIHSQGRDEERGRQGDDIEQLLEWSRSRLGGHQDYLRLLAVERTRGSLSPEEFRHKAREYVLAHPELLNIKWVGPGFVVEDVAPLEGNRQILGLKLSLPEVERASRRAYESKRPVYSGVFGAIQGTQSFELWLPVFSDERFLGLFAAVYSCPRFLAEMVAGAPGRVAERNRIELASATAGTVATSDHDERGVVAESEVGHPLIPDAELEVRLTRFSAGLWDVPYAALVGACVALAVALAVVLARQQHQLDERTRAEIALRESEEKSRAILQAFPDLVLSLDRDYGIVDAFSHERSDAVLELDDAVGRRIDEVFSEDVSRKLRTLGRAARSSGEIEIFEFRLGDGSGHVYECRLVRYSEKLLAIIRNITRRKLIEDELARYRDDLETLVSKRTRELKTSRQQLEAAERLASIGTLAAGIAHEINNPIGSILLASQAAERRGVTNVPELELIASEAKRCGRIVKSMLQFARQETTEKWPSEFNPVVERAVDVVRKLIADGEVELELRLDPIGCHVLLNPIEIEQVMTNLVQNAIYAGSSRIAVSTHAACNTVRIMVRDNGRGMSAETKSRVFEPFFTTRQGAGGSGLGLSIVHGIVTEHRGTVEVQSSPLQGTTFIIEFPVCPSKNSGRLRTDAVPARSRSHRPV